MINNIDVAYYNLLQCLLLTLKDQYAPYACKIGHVTERDLVDISSAVMEGIVEKNIELRTKATSIAGLKSKLDKAECGSVILESAIAEFKATRRR